MKHPDEDQLDSTPPAVATEVFGDRIDLAEGYWRSLATDGVVRGMIGPREVDRLWDRHLLNCGVIGEAIPEGAKVIDVGSGGGLPGIPLAIARPDLDIHLVEPLLRRTTYLGEVVTLLGLDNVTVHRGRSEEKEVIRSVGGADVVTSRAVAPLGKLAGWCLPLVRKGGEMIAMKGSSASEEIDRDAKDIRKAGGGRASIISVGKQLEEPTTLVVIERVK